MTRGPYVGPGYVRGKGPVDVYSTEKPDRMDCLTRRDEWISVNRNRVIFKKRKDTAHEDNAR